MSSPEVKSAFASFLEQPGVPLAELSLQCDRGPARLKIKQHRYFPLGSKGDNDQTWSLPICIRSGTLNQCALVDKQAAEVTLKQPGCPKDIVINAGAAGYFRFSADQALLAKIDAAEKTPREQLAFADSLVASFAAGRIDAKSFVGRFDAMVKSGVRPVVTTPIGVLKWAANKVADTDAQRAAIANHGRALYTPIYERLGPVPKNEDTDDDALLRQSVTRYLVLTARDPKARADALALANEFLAKTRPNMPKPRGDGCECARDRARRRCARWWRHRVRALGERS